MDEDDHPVGEHFRKTPAYGDIMGRVVLGVGKLAGLEFGKQGGVSRQDAEVPFLAGQRHANDGGADHWPLRRDQLSFLAFCDLDLVITAGERDSPADPHVLDNLAQRENAQGFGIEVRDVDRGARRLSRAAPLKRQLRSNCAAVQG